MKLAPLVLALPALAAPFDFGAYLNAVDHAVDRWLSPPADDYAEVLSDLKGICVMSASKSGDDTDNLVRAGKDCSILVLPSERYVIRKPLSWKLQHTVVNLKGTFVFDIPADFAGNGDALPAAFDIEGDGWVFEGGALDASAAKLGPYVALAIHDSAGGVMDRLRITAPGGIGISLDRAEGTALGNITVDTRGADLGIAPAGIATFRSHGIAIGGLKYTGAGECISIRPDSAGIGAGGIVCEGAGIGFGAVGYHPGVKEVIKNIAMKDVHISGDGVEHGILFRSFALPDALGNHKGDKHKGDKHKGDKHSDHDHPQGYATNISLSHVVIERVAHPIHLEANLPSLSDSTFHWSHVNLTHISGSSSTDRLVWLDCSPASPCHHWNLTDISLVPASNDRPELNYVCNNMEGLRGDVECGENHDE